MNPNKLNSSSQQQQQPHHYFATMKIPSFARMSIILGIILSTSTVYAFGFTPTPPTTKAIQSKMAKTPNTKYLNKNTQHHRFFMSQSSNDDTNDLTKQLQQKAKIARLEAEKLETSLVLDKIDLLLQKLETNKNKNAATLEEERTQVQNQVLDLAKRIDPTFATNLQNQLGLALPSSSSSSSIDTTAANVVESGGKDERTKPLPQGLTLTEVEAAKTYLETLPKPIQDTLAKAANPEKYKSYDEVIFKTDMIITLYEKRYALTPALLQQLYKESLTVEKKEKDEEEELKEEIYSILGNTMDSVIVIDETDEEMAKRDALVEGLFPRTLRKQDDNGNLVNVPTDEDLITFMSAIKQTNAFDTTGEADSITGGFIVRGSNNMETSTELITTLEDALSEEWKEKYQFAYVRDFDLNDINDPPVLLVTTNDFAPQISKLFTNVVSLGTLFFGLTWLVGTFAENEFVVQKLREANDAVAVGGGNVDIGWFTEELVMVLLPMALIQGAHELAHVAMAWRDKIKVTPPTILPSQTLPFLSFENKLKNSPPSFSSLYDFAMAGPAVGMTLSLITLCYGLTLTTTADVDAVQYFPGLPIGFIQLSGLGYTIVDTFLDGNGVLLTKDPSTVIPMHPFAIAGFVSLLVNALDLLPIGSTDGGRIAQTVFGRFWGHFFIGGAAFLSLIILMFTSDTQNLFFSYLLITSFTQRDAEVPCRDEVEKIGDVRLAVAFVAWFGAILTLLPSV